MSKVIKAIYPPIVTFILIIIIWIWTVSTFEIPSYIVPHPRAVLNALWIGLFEGRYYPHIAASLYATLYGYVVGCSLAFLVGAFVADSKLFERFVYPYIIAIQSMPKVALAPLIIVWFGFGIESKIVMVALICFFPVFVNTVTGIASTPQSLLNLMRVYCASPLRVYFEVKLPAAASHIFAGLQISVVFALIGTIVAEFSAAQRGLGVLIQASAQNLDVAATFGVLVILALIGIVGTSLIRLVQRRIVFWDRSRPETTNP